MTGPDLDTYFDIIKRNSKRINDLITDLLHSSKPTEVKTLKYSINDVLDETLQMAMDRLTLKGIKVIKDYADDICDVHLDKEKIKIALLDIIINAIEAMPEKEGVLKITTGTHESKCVVHIEDNGTGISKELIGRLFEPYFTNKTNGVGLGLATTHNILQSHKAVIDVESDIGKGTRFTIIFDAN
jgi:signal transduction histidine kinase